MSRLYDDLNRTARRLFPPPATRAATIERQYEQQRRHLHPGNPRMLFNTFDLLQLLVYQAEGRGFFNPTWPPQ